MWTHDSVRTTPVSRSLLVEDVALVLFVVVIGGLDGQSLGEHSVVSLRYIGSLQLHLQTVHCLDHLAHLLLDSDALHRFSWSQKLVALTLQVLYSSESRV